MSDFLSKFSGDNYGELINEENKEKKEPAPIPKKKLVSEGASEKIEEPKRIEKEPAPQRRSQRFEDEDSDIDPTYKKKKKRRIILFSMLGLLLILLLYILFYNLSRVKTPDFVDRNVSEAINWGKKYNINFVIDKEFSNEKELNKVIHQEIAPGKKSKKGGTYNLLISQGPDPDESIALPDFSTMDTEGIERWIDENKAMNVSVIHQFNEKIPRGQFIKLEFKNPNITAETYKRREILVLYVSRGEEVFSKDIQVENFVGKEVAEMQRWAQRYGVNLTVKKEPSNTIEAGLIIKQSVTAGEMISKKDPFVVTVSEGKAVVVPAFSWYNAESAAGVEGLQINLLQRYSTDVSYGFLISQSIPPGKKLTADKPEQIVLIYSLGKPYIKDLRGEVTEEELQKMFFDDYQSKGADITYDVVYIDSSEPKGLVLTQSAYATHLPLKYHVTFGVSKGNRDPNRPGQVIDTGDNPDPNQGDAQRK